MKGMGLAAAEKDGWRNIAIRGLSRFMLYLRFPESFLIDHIRHLGNIAAIISF